MATFDLQALLKALPSDTLLLDYARGNTAIKVYFISGHEHPQLMTEIGRLRKMTYSKIGASTLQEYDIDQKDTTEGKHYKQIILNDGKNIVAGCRVYSPLISDCGATNRPKSDKISNVQSTDFATSHFFQFSHDFEKNYLQYTMDIGRMFILPQFQGGFRKNRQDSFLLDCLFHSLAKLVETYKIRYLLGRVIISSLYPEKAKRALFAFLHMHHSNYRLIQTKRSSFTLEKIRNELLEMGKFIEYEREMAKMARYDLTHANVKEQLAHILKQTPSPERQNADTQQMLANPFPHQGANHPLYKQDYQRMLALCQISGADAPALIRAYLNLSPSLSFFGAARDTDLSSVEEICIMVKTSDLYKRHIRRYFTGNN